jgi:hypothetical protein
MPDTAPDTAARLFVVACKGCQRTLVTTARITDPEITTIREHARVCAYEPLTDDAPLGEVMRRVQVAVKV